MMDVEEDGPPSLVNVDETDHGAPDPNTRQLQDLSLTKVPLTIVTGTRHSQHRSRILLLILGFRIPGCWQNYTGELHSKRAAWEANSSDTKRLVYTTMSLQAIHLLTIVRVR